MQKGNASEAKNCFTNNNTKWVTSFKQKDTWLSEISKFWSEETVIQATLKTRGESGPSELDVSG